MSELKQLQVAVKQAIETEFDSIVKTVELYGDSLESVNTQAVIISMDNADEGNDIGDERVPVQCDFSALCLLGFSTANVQLEIREFALQLFTLVRQNKWNLGTAVSFPENLSIQPGPFDPEKNGYESFIVSWQQTVYVGPSVWDASGVMPTEVNLGWLPKVGSGFEADYEQI